MRALVENAVERELGDGTPLEPKQHKHRIPIGLLMLSQGWITQEQLRRALDAQREAGGKARIGKWLMQQCNLSEEQVTRALSMQWGCPVLSFSGHAARDHVDPDPPTPIGYLWDGAPAQWLQSAGLSGV